MTFILIPGFWLDGSSWDEVAVVLEQAGHKVHPLTLPGMESKDADRSKVTLRDHLDAVVEAIDTHGAHVDDLVLVGHSGGGALAHAAVDARPQSVARVVYVDSWPLGDGGAINAELPEVDGEVPLPDWSAFEGEDLVDLDDELRASFRRRAIPTPLRVTRDRQRLSDERRYEVPVTVIACEFSSETLRRWMEQGVAELQELAQVRQVDYIDLPTGHWPQFTKPRELGQAILDSVDQR